MIHKNENGEKAGLVSNIQKYTIHDGPGIRTEIFFTGCTLSCIWCSNPETISPRQRLGVYPSKCLSLEKCKLCLAACPILNANEEKDFTSEELNSKNQSIACPISFDNNGLLKSIKMQEECYECLKCANACPARAIKVWGELMTLGELMKIIEEDRRFYEKTGGGVTLSGGEVMMQWEFATELLRVCKEASINTCVETALHCSWDHAKPVLEYTDLMITDIKCFDSKKHREYTGAGNELILENIIKAKTLGKKIVIRTPIVPGYNDDKEEILKIGEFIRDELDNEIVQYQLLPYRKMGTEKYDSLGEEYPMGDYSGVDRDIWEENIRELSEMLNEKFGINAVAGSSQKLEIDLD